ncbi:MAG: hypothetical protein H7Z14_16750 [Anaerolineae bacterium]|nr:hypothetical protein [Phycisphaerae bacterium]
MKTQTRYFAAAPILALLAGLLSAAGCESLPTRSPNPRYASIVAVEPWSYPKSTAKVVRSKHYAIHTTIADDDFLDKLGELMESALAQYQQFTPGVKVSSAPMDCYVFQWRQEWADFTAQKTGDDAALYLQINRGGYTVRDWYVAYFIGDAGTYAVAAHEGWHQYVARHFKSRLPPFLEEGIATMFENVRFYRSPPVFDLSPRSHRAQKLRYAIESKNLWPLQKLMTMHAGDVVALPGAKIEAFYAQNWAFAEFLWDAENGKYRPALQRLLSDCANGTVYTDGKSVRRRIIETWNPESVRPMLEHYLEMDLPAIEQAYLTYCRKIAYASRSSAGIGG